MTTNLKQFSNVKLKTSGKDSSEVFFDGLALQEGVIDAVCNAISSDINSGYTFLNTDKDSKGVYTIDVIKRIDDTEIKRIGTGLKENYTEAYALFYGLCSVVINKVENIIEHDNSIVSSIDEITSKLLNELTGNEDLHKQFTNYFGGLRWSSAEEPLIRSLFESSTEIDEDLLDLYFSSEHIYKLISMLGADYVDSLSTNNFLIQYPELSYKREDLKNIPDLLNAYKKICGSIKDKQYKNGDRYDEKTGKIIRKPLIPLSKFPIIEEVFSAQVSSSKQENKYNFGPNDLVDFVLDSDSEKALEGLFIALNTRNKKYVFDGPSELDHKGFIISKVLSSYEKSYDDEEKHALLRKLVLSIFNSYIDEGGFMYNSLKSEIDVNGKTNHYGITDSIINLLKVTVKSPDDEIRTKAISFINKLLSNENSNNVTNPGVKKNGKSTKFLDIFKPKSSEQQEYINLYGIDNNDIKILLLDASLYYTNGVVVNDYEKIVNAVFSNENMGKQLSDFLNRKATISSMYNEPEIVKSRLKAYSSTGDEEEKRINKEEYIEKSKTVSSLSKELSDDKDKFFLEYLENNSNIASDKMLRFLIKNIGILEYSESYENKYNLSEIYNKVIELIKSINNMKTIEIIFYGISQKLDYANNMKTLTKVFVDLLGVYFQKVPGSELLKEKDFSISSISQLIHKNGKNIMKEATPEQRKIIYDLLGNAQELVSMEESKGNTINYAASSCKHLFEKVKESDMEFKRFEKMKNHSGEYYKYLLEIISDFFGKMKWEVGPGNNPTREIQDLYNTYERLLFKDIDVSNLDESIFEDPNMDGFEKGFINLVIEGFLKMNCNHQIQYNGTVWREGLGFVLNSVIYMPDKVIDEIEKKYYLEDKEKIIKHIRSEKARFLK